MQRGAVSRTRPHSRFLRHPHRLSATILPVSAGSWAVCLHDRHYPHAFALVLWLTDAEAAPVFRDVERYDVYEAALFDPPPPDEDRAAVARYMLERLVGPLPAPAY